MATDQQLVNLRIPATEIDSTFSGNTINLASATLESRLIDVSDEFFADAVNLLNPKPPISKPGTFVATGAWYDGWETRRHNASGFDYVIVRLGTAAGCIRGIEIDTAFFTGNHAPFVSVEAIYNTDIDADEQVKKIARAEEPWTTILAKAETDPSTRHAWSVPESLYQQEFTHVRLRNYPDGGIARLRIYGLARPVWPEDPSHEIELSAAQMGGIAVACSDQHYGVKDNVLLPGRGLDMGDGWETKRSREPNHTDWVVVRLGAVGFVQRVIIDTMHFRGNFPQAIRVEGSLIKDGQPWSDAQWSTLVNDRTMKADELADCELVPGTKGMQCSHVKLTIVPDGGVKRIRIFGTRTL